MRAKPKSINAISGARGVGKNSHDLRLVVDIGNTHTVVGLFQGTTIEQHWRLATRKDTTVDEIAFWLKGAISLSEELTAAAIASVVPTQDSAWLAALEDVFHVTPRTLDYRDCSGIKLQYEIPSQIGADRLANVLGAQKLGIREGVIIDFGTATTFDVFADGTYHGGVICPGIQTGLRTLVQSAAKLAEPELRWPDHVVGRNTEDALRIGILHGTVGMVESLLKNIQRESFAGRKIMVVATGGLSSWMKGRTQAIHRFEPDLTLIGINHLLTAGTSDRTKRRRAP